VRPLATAAAGDDRAAAVKQPQPSRVEEWCKTLREPAPLEDLKHGRDVGGWDYSQPVGHRHVSPALHGNGRTTTFRTAPSAATLLREPEGPTVRPSRPLSPLAAAWPTNGAAVATVPLCRCAAKPSHATPSRRPASPNVRWLSAEAAAQADACGGGARPSPRQNRFDRAATLVRPVRRFAASPHSRECVPTNVGPT
jgi:hypothetical protein